MQKKLTRSDLRARISGLPRVSLAHLPTPLHDAPNLARRYHRPVLFKRDDLTGLAFGGNKTRMFEFILADALNSDADTLVAGAAAQSNYCRQLAAAGARLGLRVVLLLRRVRRCDDNIQGNLLLDCLTGAEVSLVDASPAEQQTLLDEVAKLIRFSGGKPYRPESAAYLGAVAYVNCALEILGQLEKQNQRLSAVYLAAAGETQAGLLLAAKALALDIPIIGVNPGVDWWNVPQRVADLANQAAKCLGLDVTVDPEEVINTDAFVGPGYGLITPAAREAIGEVARLEGIFLDPVYTGKAMAGLLHDLSHNTSPGRGPVLFLHTGGVPALFHYADQLHPPGEIPDGT